MKNCEELARSLPDHNRLEVWLADTVAVIPAQTKADDRGGRVSVLPMGSRSSRPRG